MAESIAKISFMIGLFIKSGATVGVYVDAGSRSESAKNTHMTGSRNIEECYEEGQASEECSKAVTFETTKNYFAEPSSIKAAFMDNMENRSFLKWSAEFDADGVVDMDSVIAAIEGMGDMLKVNLYSSSLCFSPYSLDAT